MLFLAVFSFIIEILCSLQYLSHCITVIIVTSIFRGLRNKKKHIYLLFPIYSPSLPSDTTNRPGDKRSGQQRFRLWRPHGVRGQPRQQPVYGASY